MKYISGFNPLFRDYLQVKLLTNYSQLGFFSNFLSNSNLMMYVIILCPIISFILSKASNENKSYKTKPKLRYYSLSFLT